MVTVLQRSPHILSTYHSGKQAERKARGRTLSKPHTTRISVAGGTDRERRCWLGS